MSTTTPGPNHKRNLRMKAKRRRRRMLRGVVPTCAYCGKALYEPTTDHVVPISHGGKSTGQNLVVCCLTCNHAKGDRDLIEWAADILNAAERTLAPK